MSRVLPLLALSLLAASPALAEDDEVGGGATILVGPGYWAEDGPARLRVSVRGEAEIATEDAVGFAVVLPVDIASSGSDGFGWEVNRMLVEVVPSARLRVAPASPVRAYVDAGVGPWFQLTQTETIFGDAESQRSGFMTTAALGLEFGKTEPNSLAVVLEPIRARTYFVNEDDKVRADYCGMVGLGYRF